MLQTRLKQLYEGLSEITSSCYHYYAPSNASVPYIVWNEDSEDEAFDADNKKVRQSVSGYVEYFTQTEFDPNFDAIQAFLNGFESLSWTWESTQYGDPTNDNDDLIHHTWSWRLR